MTLALNTAFNDKLVESHLHGYEESLKSKSKFNFRYNILIFTILLVSILGLANFIFHFSPYTRESIILFIIGIPILLIIKIFQRFLGKASCLDCKKTMLRMNYPSAPEGYSIIVYRCNSCKKFFTICYSRPNTANR